jgi:hypothetical protein
MIWSFIAQLLTLRLDLVWSKRSRWSGNGDEGLDTTFIMPLLAKAERDTGRGARCQTTVVRLSQDCDVASYYMPGDMGRDHP